jgi:DNA-binding XRE family transcriptional regulator
VSESRATYPVGRGDPGWDASSLLALRHELGLTQQQLAIELGVRQQTVSEWETGAYRPRGASARLLGIVAERAGFDYHAGPAGDHPDAPGAPAQDEGAE